MFAVTLPRRAWQVLAEEFETLRTDDAKASLTTIVAAARERTGNPLTITLDQAGWSRLISAALPRDNGQKSPGSRRACGELGPIYQQLTQQRALA